MILFLYNVALLTALVVGAPWWLWKMATTQKYREGLRQRLGLVGALKSAGDGRPVIWVHAVSVGEVLAVGGLVKRLDEELPGYRVMVSTTTRTGQALARERFGAERVFYCPLDLPWAVRAWLRALKPALLVLAETEFWPNLLTGCYRRGIPVAVVNARISDRSWPRYWRLRGLWGPFLSRLTAVLAQSELDAERLRALGCERAVVGGNFKFDVRVNGEETWILKLLDELRVQREGRLRLVVAGSTLEGEEAALLEAWPEMLKVDGNLAMVVAPRHPERFDSVVELLKGSEFPWRRRSSFPWRNGTGRDLPPPALRPGEILLLDSIGELASVYSLAAVAFVGGSLVAAGGHNPLEPAQFGVPVVMGQHYENFRAIVEAMRSGDGLAIVSREKLGAELGRLLADSRAAAEMGEHGRRVFEREAGATERAVMAIREILGQNASSPGRAAGWARGGA